MMSKIKESWVEVALIIGIMIVGFWQLNLQRKVIDDMMREHQLTVEAQKALGQICEGKVSVVLDEQGKAYYRCN